MIRILLFVVGVLVSIEYLIDFEMELWQTSLCRFIIYAKKSGRVCQTKSTVSFQGINEQMNNKIYAVKYIPRYQENYFELPWFERALMTYVDHLKYQV